MNTQTLENKYQIVNGTSYHKETVEEVVNAIEYARENRLRIRVWYGKDGVSWNEENDVAGYIGRSTGEYKIPLLIHNARSMGGGGLLDNCIVKIVDIKSHRTLFQHINFKQSIFTHEGKKVFCDGKDYAPQCKNEKSSKRLCEFMNGTRHSK